ncbi:hypothetical protein K501DRAFT_265558 [Backusella circina FSU 941]|nr:hypothetical protein K501DRAFT_265558 [Backusella circina FSU 941]
MQVNSDSAPPAELCFVENNTTSCYSHSLSTLSNLPHTGWQYALKFHGAVWHGNYKHFRSFVRRRRWIRLRHRSRIPNNTIIEEEEEEQVVLVDVDPIDQEHTQTRLQKCRLDREKLDLLCNIQETPSEWLLGYIHCFDYEETKLKFIHYYFETRQVQALTENEKQVIQSLTFDSDIQAILNHYI